MPLFSHSKGEDTTTKIVITPLASLFAQAVFSNPQARNLGASWNTSGNALAELCISKKSPFVDDLPSTPIPVQQHLYVLQVTLTVAGIRPEPQPMWDCSPGMKVLLDDNQNPIVIELKVILYVYLKHFSVLRALRL